MTIYQNLLPAERAGWDPGRPQVDIVVPVRNEERDLGPSIRRLHRYVHAAFPFSARITIADNGSTDGTWALAVALSEQYASVRAAHLGEAGRGRALHAVWAASDADVLAYMDVDMSTDLNALLPLVAPLLSGHSELAIGTRLARSARVTRGPRREIISRCYNMLLHATLGTGFSDAQCGFKAIRADRARALLPLVKDTGWFFDTELLVLAERAGLRVHEVPVDWVDDPDSRVDLLPTAIADLRGIGRLGYGLVRGTIAVPVFLDLAGPPDRPAAGNRAGRQPGGALAGQLARFVVIGAASTVCYFALYLLLRGEMAAEAANAVSLLATAVANTAANRRITFGIRGRARAVRHQARGLLAFGAGLVLTSGALTLLQAVAPNPSRLDELAVLLPANLLATLLRFVLYRGWVFQHGQRTLATPVRERPAFGAAEAAIGTSGVADTAGSSR
ncbi:MAG TPA: bifunctional glycosyltransferase family 2/GtrA family protein [Streptosporangiaceae bacterium]|nr:bifunctional glycosyltransferase family 2/GtrA family protein [Streptosporangiaceae bacterium]